MLWQDLFAAIALVLVIEGIMPFVNPNSTRRTMAFISQLPDNVLRGIGLGSMLAGIVILLVVRS
ncbi:MAG: hypothetical protein ACI8P9_001193 [Parasphingorhabdus sp.]|jgi:uncharacterized protein YjeT (DUF2065 family)